VDGQLLVEQHSTLCPTDLDEDPRILGVQLLHCFEQLSDLNDLQQAIMVLQELVRSAPIQDGQYSTALGDLAVALLY